VIKTRFIIDANKILKHLLFEIRSKEKVESYGLTTILPPENLGRDFLARGDSQSIERIREWMVADLAKHKFAEKVKQVRRLWQPVEKKFWAELTRILVRPIIENYRLFPTLYGPGGSYECPDKIFIRLATMSDIKNSPVNIAHEIIHLNVEDVVQQKKLNHEDKELLVNSIMFQPEIAKILGINNEEIKKSKFYHKLDEILHLF